MFEAFAEPFSRLPDFLSGHMRLTLSALMAGLAISIPLGIIAARRPHIAGPVLAFAGVMQTIPSLALLALMVPLLGGTIGFLPAFIALTLYGVLPVLRNTIVGLQGVDPVVREAARGVGMTPLQSLMRVDIPLALPTIVAGIRTAAVWIVGTATLATPVGATSLGNYIFGGLQTRNWTTVIFGSIAAAILALVLDQLIRLLEKASAETNQRLGIGALTGLGLIIAASLTLPYWPVGQDRVGSSERLETASSGYGDDPVVIGAKGFTEQYILAEVLSRTLRQAGAQTELRENLGSTVAFDALVSGEIDVSIDYTGTLWTNVLDRDAPVDRHQMIAEITAHLWQEYSIVVLGRVGFENAYGFAATRPFSEEYDLSTITDLTELDQISIGADSEFFVRPEWERVRSAYTMSNATERAMDSTFMYGAVRDGEVDVITAYTTDGRIDAFDLVILDDPLGALPPYDAVILLSPETLQRPAIAQALASLINRIDNDLMRRANGIVDLERESVSVAADLILDEVRDEE